jgi:transcriptional regulator with GAF, ATPase, and Fis domain
LTLWSRSGDLLLRAPLFRDVLSLGSGEVDLVVSELGERLFFVELTPSGLVVSEQKGGRGPFSLAFGEARVVGDLVFALTRESAGAVLSGASRAAPLPGGASMLPELLSWVAKPMQGETGLQPALEEFLRLVVTGANALNGLLVVSDDRGFSLVANYGIDARGAEDIWKKMPSSLTEEIMRTSAQMILPDGLREKKSADKSTVFVRDIRSVVGFPVCAENRVLAIFYLNFRNVMRDLSEELERDLAGAASLAGLVMQRAVLRTELRARRLAGTASVASGGESRLMVGSSTGLDEVYRFISRLAPVDIPVLIMGETGTGKELAAREIHRRSPRSVKNFISINASAIPENLVESELFGHKKGAFTGAISDREGLVERASGGTLFIDEVGEIPLAIQAKLLRVLQEKVVTRVGDNQQRPVDFRLVAATHRNIPEMCKGGEFREDLYYRIAGGTIALPPLRERREDIRPLANFFKGRFCERHGLPQKEFSTEALAAMLGYAWPGNIRELENAVGRAVVMAEGLVLRSADLGLPGIVVGSQPKGEAGLPSEVETLEQARELWLRAYLVAALGRHGGNRAQTARTLGVSERTLFRYLEDLKIKES